MEVKGLFYLVMHLLVSEYQRIDVTEAQLRDNKKSEPSFYDYVLY